MIHTYPKKAKPTLTACPLCSEVALYEMKVNSNKLLFCAECEACLKCITGEATPDDLCKKCYCQKCAIYYTDVIHCLYPNSTEAEMKSLKKEYMKNHKKTCKP